MITKDFQDIVEPHQIKYVHIVSVVFIYESQSPTHKSHITKKTIFLHKTKT